MDVQIPNIPDPTGETLSKDVQLRDMLIAIKQTLEILTGADTNSNTSVIDYLNTQQPD